jgi:cysteine synthase A
MKILDLIGNTPLIEIPQYIHGTNNKILAKLEYFNPTKSLKDRVAMHMITAAEEKGLINPKFTTLIEPSSGNMGISLACIGGLKGYKVVITIGAHMSIERQKLIKHFGAQLVVTPAELGFKGAQDKAYELVNTTDGGFMLNQHNNPENIQAHRKTGEEIYNQTNGDIDAFVMGIGTGGVISGVSSYIKERKSLYSIGVEPEETDVLRGGTKFSRHYIQGIGSPEMPGNFKQEFVDIVLPISKQQAYDTTKMLAKKAGIAGGVSTGANAYIAIEYAKTVEHKTIVFLACDFCERYASTDLFEN